MKRINLLSFIIPFVFLILMFITNGIIFGDNSIFYSDSQYQYYQLLVYLKNVFEGVSNFNYSFQIGFGTSMISTLAYYLLTPFNILLYFFESIENFFIFQVLIKLSLCGLTMYKFLSYQKKSRSILIFSTAYALSAYNVCNYFQMMWLDAYLLAPLLLLGIDKIIKERKNLLYGIVLFITIFSNYYTGFMCSLFGIMYFIYKYLLENKKDKKVIFMFLITFVLCGLMTMFVHIPNLLELMKINRENYIDYLFNTDFLGVLSKLYLGSSDGNILNERHPYLYIGIFNLILLIFYFVNKKVDKKEKILSSLFILVLFLSILFVPLNNLWHAFSNPIGFNFRYIFLFNIFIINLCYKSFIEIKEVDKKYYYLAFILFLILSIFVFFRGLFNVVYLIISVVFFITYLICLYVNNKDIKILFYILVIAELFFNGFAILNSYNYIIKYYMNGVYNEKVSSIKMINNNSFYRMEFSKKYGFNDALHYGYYGITGFYSSTEMNEKFHDKVGLFSTDNTLYYNHSIVLDSLFGIKYYESLDKINYYKLISTNKVSTLENLLYGITYTDSYLYQNPYALSLGYMVSDKSKNEFICESGYDCQNVLMNNMIGYENNVYKFEKLDDNKIKINSNLDFYILVKEKTVPSTTFSVCVEDICNTNLVHSNRTLLVENNYEIGEELDVSVMGIDDYDIYIAYINIDNFVNNYNELKNNQLDIRTFEEDYISGVIYVEDKETLFLSITYNDNFKILVDGEEVEYYKLFDNFIGLDLEKGFHNIEIIYEVKGIKLGIIISFVSLILFIFYNVKLKRKLICK